ncbi:MAG: ROK family protein [Oscillospiraceae bacterium]|nr:ROK family protein [Oscillospiraceae bacterium]
MSRLVIGLDIGGTKCAVSAARLDESGLKPEILEREAFATPASQSEALNRMIDIAASFAGGEAIAGVGVSAGNPMDAARGILLNPPNLPGWTGTSWTDTIRERLGAPGVMENDANACAMAEWRWGAGARVDSMVFLTFGTGFGAGLILNGRLYRGVCGNAGEVGHWRMTGSGPAGYGKLGALEGYCSGGGLRQLAEMVGNRRKQLGDEPAWFAAGGTDAKTLAMAARAGDKAAGEVFDLSSQQLARGLSLMIDFLNPERIVIGSVYARCEDLFAPRIQELLEQETLADSLAACRVVPAALGDSIGDYAALSIATFRK